MVSPKVEVESWRDLVLVLMEESALDAETLSEVVSLDMLKA